MMTKTLLMAVAILATLSSCDVRTKDKIDSNAVAIAAGTDPTSLPAAPTAPPTTVEVIDTLYNFGTVAEGSIVEFSFRFKNTGTNPLVISNASASCGCTVPEKPEAPVKPGEIGVIKVKFDSNGRAGSAYKTVTVLSNAAPGFPELVLKGEVTAKTK
jgi:hypothetical protein